MHTFLVETYPRLCKFYIFFFAKRKHHQSKNIFHVYIFIDYLFYLSTIQPHIAEKLERLRWCVTEGLDSKYNITGLEQTKKFFSPFGAPVTMQPRPLYGVMRPAGAHPMSTRGRSRGPTSKRVVHGSGGTLHVSQTPPSLFVVVKQND